MITLDQAREVNRVVNEGNVYVPDSARYHRPDFWTEIDGEGDCEDYALGKRAALLAAGADPESLRLALCQVETGECHLVLVVTTDAGEYVLDNRYPEPTMRQDLPYAFVAIQEGSQWLALC